MSVDQRIIEMQFNNKEFEKNTAQTMSTLDKLKKGLNLDKSAKSLAALDSQGKKFSLAGISNGVETVSQRFTTMGIIGVTALQNITNSAINAGKTLLKSLTIDPVKSGLDEYETKMNAITTIMTNTKSKGTTLDDVNKSLADLNEYADLTIYNFAEMTRNIGTFTAAGVSLEASTSAIKGIANLAAGSGSTAAQASTAMYQLSQALASGSVKLMDWNSVVNAGMGGELFQNALKASAKEMGVFVDEAMPFRETLQSGWLSADILTKTLEGFSTNADLVAAATEVKTITQLISVMQESVQSGWSVSWENIIGDKAQATKLLTGISKGFESIVGPGADARNTMLSFWNANGGRDAAIHALSNAFRGLSSVINPIKEAFREIFPRTTGEQLVKISKAIQLFTSKLLLSKKTSDNLKMTFKGVFAVLDIGLTILKSLIKNVLKVVGVFVHFDGSLLELTANIGAFLTGVSITIRGMDVFKSAGEGVIVVLQFLAMVVYVVYKTIVDTLGKLDFGKYFDIGKIADGFMNALETMKGGLKSIDKIEVKNPFGFLITIKDKLEGPATFVGKILKKLGSFIVGFKDLVVGAFKGRSFEDAMEIIKTGLFGGGFIVAINGMRKMFKSTGKFMDSITDIFEGVKGVLKGYQNELNSKALINIAIAIGILAASMLVMSTINSNKLLGVTASMGVMLGGLVGSLAVMGKVLDGKSTVSVMGLSVALVALSVGVLIMAGALAKLSAINPDDLTRGIISIVVLTAALTLAADKMAKSTGSLAKKSLGLIAFASAIGIMVTAVEQIGKLNFKELVQGIGGLVVITGLLLTFLKYSDVDKMSVGAGVGMMALAAGMWILSKAIGAMGSMDIVTLAKGLITLGFALAFLGKFVKIVGSIDEFPKVGSMMILLAGGLFIMAQAIKVLGNMKLEELGKGLGGLAIALASIVVAFKLMPEDSTKSASSILSMSLALVGIAVAMKILGSMKLEEIGKALVGVGGALVMLVAATKILGTAGGGAGAGAMILIAIALNLLVVPLMALGAMSWGALLKSIVGLGLALGVLGVAAVVLTPILPIIALLGLAISAMGVGALAAGLGLTFLAAGLVALAAGGATSMAALGLLIDVLANGLVTIIQKIGEGIVAVIVVLGNSAVSIADAFGKILIAVLEVIAQAIPKVMDVFARLFVGLIEVIAKYTPDVVNGFFNILLSFIETVTENIPGMVEAGVNIIYAFLEGVASMAVGVIDAAFNMMITFINGLADSIDNNTPIVYAAVTKLFNSLIDAAIYVLTNAVKDFPAMGKKLVMGIKDGVVDMLPNVVKEFLGIATKSLDKLRDKVKDFKDIGINMAKGLLGGVKDKAGDVVDGVKDVGKKALGGIKGFFKIKSPSRVMKWVGEMMDVGWADGLTENSMLPVDAGVGVGEETSTAIVDTTEEGIVEGTPAVAAAAGNMTKEAGKAAIEGFEDYLTERKNLGDLTMAQELEQWEKFQSKYKDGTDERIKADKEVYRLKKEMLDGMTTIEENYNTGMAKLREDYIKDTEAVTKAYDDAVVSRAQSIYNSFGLFDKLAGPEMDEDENIILIDPKELSSNLEGQVAALKEWRENIDNLTERGVSTDLMKELTDMGPDASDKLEALNKLTEDELDVYVDLWTEKHQLARWQATEELIGLKKDTKDQISEITKATGPAVEELKNVWMTQMGDLTGKNHEELLVLKKDFNVEVSAIKADTEVLFTKMKDAIEAMDWESTGSHIVSGMAAGVAKSTPKVEKAVSTMAARSLQAANSTLDINSPSRKFMKVGEFSVMGLINGLKDKANGVGKAGADLGGNAMSSLKLALNNISSIVSGDMELAPTISPVLDMAGISSEVDSLNGLFSRKLSVGTSYSSARNIPNTLNSSGTRDGSDTVNKLAGLLAEQSNSSEVDLTGTLTVQVANDKGEIVSIAQTAITDLLRRESR